MNDIIKLIFLNILLYVSLYYDKRIGILLIIIMSIYVITMYSSQKSKLVEGYGFYRNFVETPNLKYDYSPILPTSVQYNSEESVFSDMYSFFKGGGHYGIVQNEDVTKLEETNELLDKLIDMFDKKQQNCIGEFSKFSDCSKKCGFGKQERVYRIIQDKGDNGMNCEYEEGHKIETDCILRSCNIGEECQYNEDCIGNFCDSGICSRRSNCDRDFKLQYCLTEEECMNLNLKYKTREDNRFIWEEDNLLCYQDSPLIDYTEIYEREFLDRPEPKPVVPTPTPIPTPTPTPTPT